jgi:hypothetical protein
VGCWGSSLTGEKKIWSRVVRNKITKNRVLLSHPRAQSEGGSPFGWRAFLALSMDDAGTAQDGDAEMEQHDLEEPVDLELPKRRGRKRKDAPSVTRIPEKWTANSVSDPSLSIPSLSLPSSTSVACIFSCNLAAWSVRDAVSLSMSNQSLLTIYDRTPGTFWSGHSPAVPIHFAQMLACMFRALQPGSQEVWGDANRFEFAIFLVWALFVLPIRWTSHFFSHLKARPGQSSSADVKERKERGIPLSRKHGRPLHCTMREPKPEDFESAQAYDFAWKHWRHVRDSNNESVRLTLSVFISLFPSLFSENRLRANVRF